MRMHAKGGSKGVHRDQRRSPYACVVMLFAMTLCLGPPFGAQAQEAALGPVAVDPAEAFGRGVDAYDQGRYEEALEAFESSYGSRPVPVVLYNIARTQIALDRAPEAARTLREYLRDEGEPPERRETAQADLATLQPHYGMLFVELGNGAAGGRILVDGEVEAPGEDIVLAPGEHRLTVHQDGDTLLDRTVHVHGGMTVHVLAERTATPVDTDNATSPWPPTGPLIVLGVSAGLVVTGTVLMGVAASDLSDVEGATTWSMELAEKEASAESNWVGGQALIWIGLAGAAAGATWWYLDSQADSGPAISVTPGGVTVRGHF